MKVTFHSPDGPRMRVYVNRDDGTEANWDWPREGRAVPPHDLVHYVVETQLGLTDAFWGLVSQGVDFGFINQASHAHAGRKVRGLDGRDLDQLRLAECVVGTVTSMLRLGTDEDEAHATIVAGCADLGIEPPAGLTPERVAALRDEVAEAAWSWPHLPPRASIIVDFPQTDSD